MKRYRWNEIYDSYIIICYIWLVICVQKEDIRHSHNCRHKSSPHQAVMQSTLLNGVKTGENSIVSEHHRSALPSDYYVSVNLSAPPSRLSFFRSSFPYNNTACTAGTQHGNSYIIEQCYLPKRDEIRHRYIIAPQDKPSHLGMSVAGFHEKRLETSEKH